MQSYMQSQYKKVDIVTADQGKLVVLLYDGAINFIHRAKKCAHDRDPEGKCNNINRAYDIIQELNFSLNTEEGGEIAFNLRRLYLFMLRELIQAKIDRDGSQNLDHVITMLNRLNQAWREIGQPKAAPQNNLLSELPRLSRDLSA